MTRIKFCGIRKEEDVKAVNELLPDFTGFVFWNKSKRCISRDEASSLKRIIDPEVICAGVFVDEDIKIAEDYLNKGVIDIAQLHGSESTEYIRALRADTGKKIIKAFKIISPEDLKDAYVSEADYVLLDAGKGDGITFDWSLIKDFDRPFFLAGGLNAENVAEAIERIRPFAVDVSSGIETDGLKDYEKMRKFKEEVRKGDQSGR